MGQRFCADCAHMQTGANDEGLFKCKNSRSGYEEVAANMLACAYFTGCFNSRRGESEREKLMAISRHHRGYIVGAIVNTLDLPDAETYINAFGYYREVMLPIMMGGSEWLDDYDTYGPVVANEIRGNVEKCQELFDNIIEPFTTLIGFGRVDRARLLYNKMYDDLKAEYGVETDQRTQAPKLRKMS